ncbi:hypothetical protein TNCV_1792231 [Trichonephila clavipes]|nr:hypothetical protein TNCV_1792231 [Trichonephila clavipes]
MPDIKIDDNCLFEVERRLDVHLNSNKLEQLENQHAEKLRNVSPSEQEEDERGSMPTSAIKDILKKWEAVRANGLRMAPKPS